MEAKDERQLCGEASCINPDTNVSFLLGEDCSVISSNLCFYKNNWFPFAINVCLTEMGWKLHRCLQLPNRGGLPFLQVVFQQQFLKTISRTPGQVWSNQHGVCVSAAQPLWYILGHLLCWGVWAGRHRHIEKTRMKCTLHIKISAGAGGRFCWMVLDLW